MSKPMLRWTIGGVVVVLIALVTWLGVRPPPSSTVITGTGVILRDPPVSATAGDAVPFRWEVRAPVGASATHTAIHWGTASHAGALGPEVAPAAAGYPNMLPDYASGNFALPRAFEGAVAFGAPSTYYYRAHAIIGNVHFWTSEHTIVVR